MKSRARCTKAVISQALKTRLTKEIWDEVRTRWPGRKQGPEQASCCSDTVTALQGAYPINDSHTGAPVAPFL